ncbi:MAG: diacylglycerol/lipid kinase family protein [Blastocatellia bacterium]
MTRATLIYNPVAGALRRDLSQMERLIPALRERGIEVTPHATAHAGHAVQLAAEAVEAGVDVAIVCGGDGTINEAAQALVGTRVPLAIWPCGTANILAKELRLPRNERAFAKLIAEGRGRTISAGRAMKPGTGWERYFLLMAGIGMDAKIVDGMNPGLKRLAGKFAYLASGLDYLARLPQTPFSIDLNGSQYESTFAVVSNAAHYAAWFTLAPGAELDDDRLDVCVFNTHSRLAYLWYALMSLTGGRHVASERVVYQPARQIKANSNDAALVQLDGDVVGHLPMKFEIVPNALRVIAPEH